MMQSVSPDEQQVIDQLTSSWIWAPNFHDFPPSSPNTNTAGRLVTFTRTISLPSSPTRALLHLSADTRYKLLVNSQRVAVGPCRGSPIAYWYYDTLDIAQWLKKGENEVKFVVLRYFPNHRGAMAFERTSLPGLTVVGSVEMGENEKVDLGSMHEEWRCSVDESVRFPMGLVDDGFLHINERISPLAPSPLEKPIAYKIKTINGELAPWRLRPRPIPVPVESPVDIRTVRNCTSSISSEDWSFCLAGGHPLTLSSGSSHTLDIQAECHSTAFLQWTFFSSEPSQIQMKVTYSEGYEHSPPAYPFFRHKTDRLDASRHIIGPSDSITLTLPSNTPILYSPFWFRTFRILRLILSIPSPFPAVTLLSLTASQTNYPLHPLSSISIPSDRAVSDFFSVSIRTLRNCLFDAYSDCPFYEQLQYAGDTRSVALFHYLLAGDDRLMRQAISLFAGSVTVDGIPQSRFPSHTPQIIAGFTLFWVLSVGDHFLYFGDAKFTKQFLPRVDGVLEWFDGFVDARGLVSGLPRDVWQYVDWVSTWGATGTHPDKGVPTAGRQTNCHTFFSMLYAYVLRQAATLVRDVGRPGYAQEYEARADNLVRAIRTHCFDTSRGFFTDSTVSVCAGVEGAVSQHCQVFAVLCGAAEDPKGLLTSAFAEDSTMSKCSYVMKFYALRAMSLAGDEVYEAYWSRVWEPWRKMLRDNLSTWEEDDVRQRSDCHAWGCVPVYEYCTEVAGVRPIGKGCAKVLFKPRLGLTGSCEARVCLGRNLATVKWETGNDRVVRVEVRFENSVELVVKLPGKEEVVFGSSTGEDFTWRP